MKCIILGAGATAFCDIANPDRRPPLVTFEDFSRLIDSPVPGSVLLSQAGAECYKPLFSWAVREFTGDLEEFFTCIFQLQSLTRDVSDEEFVQHTERVYGQGKTLHVARKMQECGILRGLGGTSARNTLEIFSGVLYQELWSCLGTTGEYPYPAFVDRQPISNDHRKTASCLSEGDVVISFNYDWVMPYALLNENRLVHTSFENPYFKRISIPSNRLSERPVKLVTPHGSFTWLANINNLHEIVVNFEDLGKEGFGQFGVPCRIILPFKCKESVYETMPVFKYELNTFLRYVALCDELHLIGKQFNSGDKDLASLIANACAGKRRKVTYVNPDSSQSNWLDEHNHILNVDANYVTSYSDFSSYVESL